MEKQSQNFQITQVYYICLINLCTVRTPDTRLPLLLLASKLAPKFLLVFIDRCAKRLRWNWMLPEIGIQMKYPLENVARQNG